jgi:two-component system chemotaxis sensor kinase CheA
MKIEATLAPVAATAAPFETLQALARRYAQHTTPPLLGYVKFVAGLSLVGLKAQLLYEKLASLGSLLDCTPPLEGVDDLDTLDYLIFAVASEASIASIRSRLFVAGVSEVQVFSASELLGEPAPAAVADDASPAVASTAPVVAGKSRGTNDASRPNETLRVDIERLDQLMNLAGQLVINKARFTKIGESLRESLFSKQTPQRLSNAANLTKKALHEADRASSEGKSTPELEAMRSHVRRLQGDLEVVQRELARVGHLRSRVNDLFEAVHQLDRVADGIQKTVMDTRMVPIGPLFGRFKRVVRDITRINNKDINLIIRGEKTELDKRMIDELGDPLIHMVRNGADHGIESPEARVAAGKPAQGTLTLDAFHRGNSIIIQVADDGSGLDKDRILAKAVERKLISAAEAERMTPQQAFQLIWEPGFSTAEKVTEISGRGMGMDIVRSKIEDISGTVEVDSRPGQGTTFTIKLPLTLAILPSLMAEIAGDVFALPVESIVEIVSVPRDALATVHGMRTAMIRSRVVSVVELDELFTWNERVTSARGATRTDCTLVVLGQEGREIGLRVDALLGEEDVVIKSMAENYRNVAGIAGASILGSGRVSLILDVAALIALSARQSNPVI